MASEFARAWEARGHLASRVKRLDSEEVAAIARGMARRSNGYIASRKNDDTVVWRLKTERDLMRVFELDHGIVSYASMPEKVEFILDGKRHRVVPAIRARTTRGPMAFDVLRSNASPSPARQAILDAVSDAYRQVGVRYCWLTPAQVRVEPRFTNVTYARHHRGIVPDGATRLRILDLISMPGRTWTVASLRAALGPEANGLFTMAMCRMLRLDLSANAPEEMAVTFGEGGLL